uniref:LBH domain-containing protein n=1 Tax=Neogobius melanostomus TaxID=47308 RepID=A0A8C6THE4_9GOBI
MSERCDVLLILHMSKHFANNPLLCFVYISGDTTKISCTSLCLPDLPRARGGGLGCPACTVNHVEQMSQEQEKERLPSIVVEPTEVSEVESGELRWPPENYDLDEDEEDLFLEQCIPPANIADWGEEEDKEEETFVIFNPQPGLTLIDLQSDAFRDDTPTLPPSNASAFN